MTVTPRMNGRVPHGSPEELNPVIRSAEIALEATSLVTINAAGVSAAARYIRDSMHEAQYTPRTWRTHPLHMLPPNDGTLEGAEPVLNWIFLVSALNFSFWSELGDAERYAVEWRAGWTSPERERWTGYWSLVAAIDRALDEGIPITDPAFYASPEACPDELVRHVFRAASDSKEGMPLLEERIAILREVGSILTNDYNGSFLKFAQAINAPRGLTPLLLSRAVTSTFPSFRDETLLPGTNKSVQFWKRTQILSAEAWAAFYPEDTTRITHPLFPGGGAETLTMFADYRIPQILHHLGLLNYPRELVEKLEGSVVLEHGCREEISIRASSIVAVERVAEEMHRMQQKESAGNGRPLQVQACSVLIDFYLWDLAKRIESGEEGVEGLSTQRLLPTHRTRSIWY
ncbi:hypothetical protein PENSPDRAFT_742536 [Peniophora sp. CONT]|nr:hypothetical protein PENSPDRAFT_742536 [Peniophora sp. CONT]